MTTLGALLVCLLLLLLLLGALVWMQRRPPRGPEQPRTVADLVRMREAAAASPAEAPVNAVSPETDSSVGTRADIVSSPVDAEPVAPDVGSQGPGLPGYDASETADDWDEPAAAAVGAAPTLDDAAVDTPWARAARMAEPWPEWSAESDESDAPPEAPSRPSLALLPTYPTRPFVRPERPSAAAEPSPVLLPSTEVPGQAEAVQAPAEPEEAPPSDAPSASAPQPTGAVADPAPPPAPAPQPAAAALPDPATLIETSGAQAGVPATGPDSGPHPSTPEGPAEADQAPAAPVDRPAPHPFVPAAAASSDIAEDGPAASAGDASWNGVPAACEPTAAEITRPAGEAPAHPRTNGHAAVPTPARVAGRVRRSPAATAAEQAAANLALLRTFGIAGPDRTNAADEPEVELEGCATDDDEPVAGRAQPIAFRVLARDGRGIAAATVTLLDDHGRETASTRTDPDGHGVLTARHPGGYMLVMAADGYQPGAITVAVTDGPVDAEIPLARSASITGTVGGEDGPIAGAQLALVQDGEIVDTTHSSADGTYRFPDLAAGEYGLSISAHECETAALVLELADEAELRQDVDLVPAGLPSDDVMIGPR